MNIPRYLIYYSYICIRYYCRFLMRCTMTVYTTDFCAGQYYDLLTVLEMLPDYRDELITRESWHIYADGLLAASIVVVELTPCFRFYWQFPKNDCVFPISNLI